MRQAKPRIAIAGFQHETNCFGINKAGLAEFEMADSGPPCCTERRWSAKPAA